MRGAGKTGGVYRKEQVASQEPAHTQTAWQCPQAVGPRRAACLNPGVPPSYTSTPTPIPVSHHPFHPGSHPLPSP